MLAKRTPLQINKTEGHLTRKPEERRPVCLTDLTCCTGELSGTKVSLFTEPAWDTSVFIRLIENKSTSRALDKSREWRSSMQTKWHMRPSWMRLTFQWKTFSFHSNTLTTDIPHLAFQQIPVICRKISQVLEFLHVQTWPWQMAVSALLLLFFFLLYKFHSMKWMHKSHHRLSSMPLSQENKT